MTTGINLRRLLGLRVPSFELLPRVEGIALFNYPVVLSPEGKRELEWVWNLGRGVPESSEMLLAIPNGLKGLNYVAVVPADAAKKAGLVAGDWVSARTQSTAPVRLDPEKSPVELPKVVPLLVTMTLARVGNPDLWMMVNGQPANPDRRDWRFSDLSTFHPDDCYDLGDDPRDEGIQMIKLVGELPKGGKVLIISMAGGGKTLAAIQMAVNAAKYNTGRPVLLVFCFIGERPEDASEAYMYIMDSLHDHGRLLQGIVDIRFIVADADFLTMPFELLRVLQAAVGFAQQQAVLSASLPPDKRFDVLTTVDCITRGERPMKFAKLGKGMMETGGIDPYATVLQSLVEHTARAVGVPNPETGEIEDKVYFTGIFTQLGDVSRLSPKIEDEHAATVNFRLAFLGEQQKPGGLHRYPVLFLPAIQRRHPQRWLPGWKSWRGEADSRLRARVYTFDEHKQVARLREDAILFQERLLDDNLGLGIAALKSLLPADHPLRNEERERAKALLLSAEGTNLEDPKDLALRLVAPPAWTKEFWDEWVKEFAQKAMEAEFTAESKPEDLAEKLGIPVALAVDIVTKLPEKTTEAPAPFVPLSDEEWTIEDHLAEAKALSQTFLEPEEVAAKLGIPIDQAREVFAKLADEGKVTPVDEKELFRFLRDNYGALLEHQEGLLKERQEVIRQAGAPPEEASIPFNKAIIDYLQETHGLVIGKRTANRLARKLGRAKRREDARLDRQLAEAGVTGGAR